MSEDDYRRNDSLTSSGRLFKFLPMVRITKPKTKDRKGLKKEATSQRKYNGDGLKAQIRAVGGDIANDYELVKDVDSDGMEGFQHSSEDVSSSFIFRELVLMLYQPNLGKDIAHFMKSLDFGPAKHAATPQHTGAKPEGSGSGARMVASRDASKRKGRALNGKLDARVAEVSTKVVEVTRGGKTKFVLRLYQRIKFPLIPSPRSSPQRLSGISPSRRFRPAPPFPPHPLNSSPRNLLLPIRS